MSDVTPSNSNPYPNTAVAEALDNIIAGLERVMAGLNSLKSHHMPGAMTDAMELDPKDPANKEEVGGQMKFTPRGVEVCYRLFDAGKSRYAVAEAMGISFGAAKHRYEAWKKLGGVNRTKQRLG